jgi:hypothetical protein
MRRVKSVAKGGARAVYRNETPELATTTADSHQPGVDDEFAILYYIGPLRFTNFDPPQENHWLWVSKFANKNC